MGSAPNAAAFFCTYDRNYDNFRLWVRSRAGVYTMLNTLVEEVGEKKQRLGRKKLKIGVQEKKKEGEEKR